MASISSSHQQQHPITIYCQNAGGIHNKTAELQKLLGSSPCPPVICLNETWTKSDLKISLLQQHQCFYQHRDESKKKSNGLAIFVRQDIAARLAQFPHSQSLYTLSIIIHHQSLTKPLIISQIYIPPTATPYHSPAVKKCINLFSSIKTYATTINADWIMLGDFNARSPTFSDTSTNPIGNYISSYLTNSPDIHNLNMLHCPGQPTRIKSGSIIDLAFTHTTTKDTFITKIQPPTLMSDHEAIIITITKSAIPIQLTSTRKVWDTKQFSTITYHSHLNHSLEEWLTKHNLPDLLNTHTPNYQQTIDTMWSELRESILHAASKTSTKKTITKHYKTWINETGQPHANALDADLAAMQDVRRQYLTGQLCTESYQEALKAFRSAILNRKHAAQHRTLSKADIAGIFDWKPMKEIHSSTTFAIPPIQLPGGLHTSNLQESVDALARHFAATSNLPETPVHLRSTHETAVFESIAAFLNPPKKRRRLVDDDDNYDQPSAEFDPKDLISLQQVKQACEELELNKSVGPDDIHPLFLREGNDLLFSCIRLIFNYSLRWSVLPLQWKQALVVPILKPGQNASDKSSYRPISLTCIICKCIERVILRRLNSHWHGSLVGIGPRSKQAGFTEGAGTEYQLLRVREAQLAAIKNHQHRPFVFLDISKAFDRVWHAGLIAALIKHHFDRYLIFWIAAFLLDRLICVVYAGLESQWYSINAGVPQGAVLSPFLFLVFISPVTHLHECDLALFADDLAAWFEKSLDLDTQVNALNRLMKDLLTWSTNNKVIFSPTKSVVMNAGNTLKQVNINLGNDTLECVREFKYLGVIFSYNGEWDAHVKHVIQKAHQPISTIRSSLPYFNRLSSLPFLINTCIIPIITYGWPCWKPNKTQLTALQQIYLSLVRDFCHLSRSCLISGIRESLGLPDLIPLHHLSILRAESRCSTFSRWHVAAYIAEYKVNLHRESLPWMIKGTNRYATHITGLPNPDDRTIARAVSKLAHFTIPLSPRLDSVQIAVARIRLRLHQTNLRRDLLRRHLITGTTICPHCSLNEHESTLHLISRCSLFSTQRATMISSIRQYAHQHRLDIPYVLDIFQPTHFLPINSVIADTILSLCIADFNSLPEQHLLRAAREPNHIFHTRHHPTILKITGSFIQSILDNRPL